MENTTITTDTHTIQPKDEFTMPGWIINQKCDYSDHLNAVSSKIHHIIHRANEVKKYMSESTRKIFADFYLFSVVNYGAPPYFQHKHRSKFKDAPTPHDLLQICEGKLQL